MPAPGMGSNSGLNVPQGAGSGSGVMSRGGDGPGAASLFDVMHGTSQSRAVVNRPCKYIFKFVVLKDLLINAYLIPLIAMRFQKNGRVSAAVDMGTSASPTRLNPNTVLKR
jgi:hypothetical protein